MSFSSNPHILSVGLGLAYNELISVAYFEKSNICNFKLVSYEKEQTLIDGIREWTHLGERAMGPWVRGYEIILAYTADSFGLPKTHLRQALSKAIDDGQWVLRGALTPGTQFSERFHCIFYDAFSAHTDQKLWESGHLVAWLSRACASECLFTTYAAKGSLARALRSQGFEVIKRPGFGGKRHSIWAVRSDKKNILI